MVGLFTAGLLLAVVLIRLLQRSLEGDTVAPAFLASILGFLFVAVFNSLFEAPRLASVFYLVVFAALCMTQPIAVVAASAGRKRRHSSR